MTNEEIKEKYDIEPIMKEMWVWDDDNSEAKLKLVLIKDLSKKNQYALLTWSKDGMLGVCSNASETNPNYKEPKVGDMGYFWDEDEDFYAYCLLEVIDKRYVLPYLCGGLFWIAHFSHVKQPWMK